MWEFSVIVPKKDILALTKIEMNIKNKFKNEIGVCSILQKQDNNVLLIAYEDSKKAEIIKILQKDLTNFIVTTYKEEILRNNLNIENISNLKKEALVKSLLFFDREYDEEYIKGKLCYINSIHISSFFSFRLKSLKLKWLEICDITNSNIELLNSSDAFYEILQFLVTGLGFKRKIINVIYSDACYLIYDENDKLVCNLKEETCSENLVSVLIGLRSENVNIYSDEKMPSELLIIINKIYSNKVALYSKSAFKK